MLLFCCNNPFGQTAGHAYTCAFAAANAFAVIDGCNIVRNGNCAKLTGLFTFFAADTADRTGLLGYSALVLAGAQHCNSGCSRNNPDNLLGACLCAQAAANTLFIVNNGNALVETDGIVGTNLCTISQPEASKDTASAATIVNLSSSAAGNAVIFTSRGCLFAIAIAADNRNLFFDIRSLNAQNLTDLLGHSVTTGHAQVGPGAGFKQCTCITVTAAEAASAAICAGQAVSDGRQPLIFFNLHDHGCN